ncbi:CAP domain-containing protein [Paenibacillus illinoisensis]|uniref:CAP domain-containing protein n=1 Tax=Paenibacillus illinoisensis TaxID=59845 RepID=UPI000FDC8D8E|nr:CAP domain-containing protein [Paenibacillus illinoisensis]
MAKFFILTILLLVAGCSSHNNMMQKQVTPEQKQISIHDHAAAPNSVLTQASSTATSRQEGSITTKEAQNGIPLDLLDLIRTPDGNTVNQAPAGNLENKEPTGQVQEGKKNTTDKTDFEQQVLDLVNQERAKTGLSSLSRNEELSNVAMVKAQDMYNHSYFDHNSPTHGSPFDMMKEFGITYNTAGENIAKGQTTPTQVMKEWMNSPGHKANILNNSYTHIGIAYYNNTWVQEFTG